MTDSTNGPERQPAHEAGPFPVDVVGVEGPLLNDLAISYARYRQALTGTFDPVKTLALTGDVLHSVRRILTAGGQTPSQCPVNRGKAVQ